MSIPDTNQWKPVTPEDLASMREAAATEAARQFAADCREAGLNVATADELAMATRILNEINAAALGAPEQDGKPTIH